MNVSGFSILSFKTRFGPGPEQHGYFGVWKTEGMGATLKSVALRYIRSYGGIIEWPGEQLIYHSMPKKD